MFDKLKLKHKAGNVIPADPVVNPGQAPTTKQIYQLRKNIGVNFGSCFVLEKWIFHSLFVEDTGNDDYELIAVDKMIKKLGEQETKSRFESHWNNYVNEEDWKWLQDHHINSIRLPIGYWEVDGGNFTKGLKFEKFKSIYSNAWNIIKLKFIEQAAKYNISILIDIHGLPFGANHSSHSGEQGENKFWDDGKAQLLMTKMFSFIAEDLNHYDNIAGIQIVNEADFADPPKKQIQYYSATINEIRSKDSTIPIIISDGWWTNQWVEWIQNQQGDNDHNIGVVIDHHVYRCFSDEDKSKDPNQIIHDLDKDVLTNLTNDSKGVDIMVGEYSCVLDNKSWEKLPNANRNDIVRQYGNKQCDLLYSRTCGFYFWTFKFESGNGGEWDLKTMINEGAIKFPSLPINIPSRETFENSLNQAYNDHTNYWNSTSPNEKFEHDRYKDGFITGWADSEAFGKFNGSIIGRKQALKHSRLQEHINVKGNLRFIWEWEQGFDKGIQEFSNNCH